MRRAGPGPPSWLGTIRVRILAVVVLLLAAASAGSVVLLRVALHDRLDVEVAEQLSREVAEFQLLRRGDDPRTGEPFGGDVRAVFDVYFSREIPDEGESLLAFVDGRLYESRRAPDAARAEQVPRAVEHWLSRSEPDTGTISTEQGEVRYAALPLDGDPVDGVLVVANFPAFEQGEIDDAVQVHIAVQLLTLAVAVALAALLAGRVLRPLVSLAATARTISETDLARRIPVTGRDEASLIAEAFNDMLERLERAMTAQRQFLDDTSHELRTPLTVIRGHLELLPLDERPQDRQATVDLVVDEVDRISRMVDDLFLLARAEQPDFLRLRPMDLSALVRDVHGKVQTLGDRRWLVSGDAHVDVLGDPQRLTQAAVQLVANAVRHTTDGDVIRLSAAAVDGVAVLAVSDSGPGIAPEDADRVFTRLHRAGSPRDNDGGGLGLSIVRAIAEAHGGTARLVAGQDAGACFQVVLPLRPAPGEPATPSSHASRHAATGRSAQDRGRAGGAT